MSIGKISRALNIQVANDGTWRFEGVAYIADQPNINGHIYPLNTLRTAFGNFMKKSVRPVFTKGAEGVIEPKLAEIVGFVEDGTLENGIVWFRMVSVALSYAKNEIRELLQKGWPAFSGCAYGELQHDLKTVKNLDIAAIRLVTVDEVDPDLKSLEGLEKGQTFFVDGTQYGEDVCSIVEVVRIKEGDASPYSVVVKFRGSDKQGQYKPSELISLSQWVEMHTGV